MSRGDRERYRGSRDDRRRDPERERRRGERSDRRRRDTEPEDAYDSDREAAREARREARRRDPERTARHEERKRRRREEQAAIREQTAIDEEREARREERRRDREWRISQQEARRALDDSRGSGSRDRLRPPPTDYSRTRSESVDSREELRYERARRETRETHRRPEPAARRKKTRVDYSEKFTSLPETSGREGRDYRKSKRRIVSGALLEEGNSETLLDQRGGARRHKYTRKEDSVITIDEDAAKKKKKKLIITIGIILLALAVIVPVAVVLSKKSSAAADENLTPSDTSDVGKPSLGALDKIDPSSIPSAVKGTDLDPFSWLDTTDFNLTYTDETVGGLPVMGLFSKWDDSASANNKVPALDEEWGSYDERPARGVNVGGWLNLEPFITPSFFNRYPLQYGIIDEWTFCEKLGRSQAKAEMEKHYVTFINEQTFKEIRDAGLDHVRIPFGYWAVKTFADEPLVERVAWRYMLRAIEWARKYGLRVNLDPHGMPGSQNGWNHSGRQGDIGWLNGTDGALNAERSLEIHKSLATFFSQPRYKNIVAFYGLVNEPKMTALRVVEVNEWSGKAYKLIREAGITCPIVFGDGFLGLDNWQGELQSYEGLVLDVHQYVIFNVGQLVFDHQSKVKYACTGWTDQSRLSMDRSTGFGPTIFAEWSQADTDCTTYLNNVGWGSRWEGTYDTGNPLTRVLSPVCPTNDGSGPPCTCREANADPSSYSDSYKLFLKMFAEAQMHSFEEGWGWFYWTWKTETAHQWSYKKGLEAGILPMKAYDRVFDCTQPIPEFDDLPENY